MTFFCPCSSDQNCKSNSELWSTAKSVWFHSSSDISDKKWKTLEANVRHMHKNTLQLRLAWYAIQNFYFTIFHVTTKYTFKTGVFILHVVTYKFRGNYVSWWWNWYSIWKGTMQVHQDKFFYFSCQSFFPCMLLLY